MLRNMGGSDWVATTKTRPVVDVNVDNSTSSDGMTCTSPRLIYHLAVLSSKAGRSSSPAPFVPVGRRRFERV
jgi:hypothetical protein